MSDKKPNMPAGIDWADCAGCGQTYARSERYPAKCNEDAPAVEPEPWRVNIGTPDEHVSHDEHLPAVKPEQPLMGSYACRFSGGTHPCDGDCPVHGVELEQPTYRRSTAERAAAKGNAGAKALSDTTTNFATREELEDTVRQALEFASECMQQLGWARQQGPELSRELDKQERDAYALFHACWAALRMGPKGARKRA